MAGIKLKVDEEGVAILNSIAEGVETGVQDINSTAEELLDEIGQYPALGPHKDSIIRTIKAIKEETEGSTNAVRVVARKLREKAQEYQEWIDDDFFGNSSGK